MAYTDYIATSCNVLSLAATGTEQRWGMMLAALAGLKANSYNTRGSSRTGSAGTVFSATPDGVDSWTGRTAAQAAAPGSGNMVWHILEHTTLGHQVLLAINPTNGDALWITGYSLNKFETAGAWRAGGTSAIIRPTDTISTPAAGREIVTSSGIAPLPQSVSNYYNNMFVRVDGKGFYFYSFRDTTPNALSDHFLTGFFPLTTPDVADVNPTMVISSQGAGLNVGLVTSNAGFGIVGRNLDGATEAYIGVNIGDASSSGYLQVLDPWKNKYPAHALLLKGATNKYIRGWVPDLYVSSGAVGDPNFATRNTKTYFKVNNPSSGLAILAPWDGVTTRGTDVAMFRIPESGIDGPVTTPAPVTPTNLVATPGNSSIALTWDLSPGAVTYTVKRSLSNGGPYTNLVVPSLAHTYYTDSAVSNGTPYYYVVSAVNGTGESADSTQATATPAAPVAPLVDTIVPSNGSQLGGATAITFHVTDLSPGLNTTYIWIKLANEVTPILAYNGTTFEVPFLTLSTKTPIANGYAYSIQYDGGWPAVVSLVTVAATDLAGAVTEQSFGYIAVPPPALALQNIRAVDARTLDIVFNRAVVQTDAENVANYSISPTLTVFRATKLTDFNYRLTTSQQVLDQAYSVTISGINPQ